MNAGNAQPSTYTRPVVSDLGTLSDVTLSTITKSGVSGDVVVINGVGIPVPGSSVTSVGP